MNDLQKRREMRERKVKGTEKVRREFGTKGWREVL